MGLDPKEDTLSLENFMTVARKNIGLLFSTSTSKPGDDSIRKHIKTSEEREAVSDDEYDD